MTNNSYSFNEHKHRYALWTAARAVQRSFAKTKKICAAVAATTLQNFAERETFLTQEEFDRQHVLWCTELMAAFEKQKILCSFGRAAKIVAIYLKTSVILPQRGEGHLAQIIHPPIDRILLQKLARLQGLSHLAKENWTGFDQAKYQQVSTSIKNATGQFNWLFEANWKIGDVD